MKNLLIFFGFLFSISIYSQKEPILFLENYGGWTNNFSDGIGVLGGVEINYQKNKNLFSLRYTDNPHINNLNFFDIIFPFITIEKVSQNREIAFLYGKRRVDNNMSLSFSGGVSYVFYQKYIGNNAAGNFENQNHLAFPFEANVKWFKSHKSPYTILGVIPVGKPTSIGNSIGFKLLGNVSKHSYVGFALVYGIGIHKEY